MRHGRKRGGHCPRYHHGDLRAALIEAGLKALEDEKASELSLRYLARQIGVTPPAAYRHFTSKDTLLGAICEEGFARLNAAFDQALTNHEDPQERLLETGLTYVRFAKENPALFRLMFGGEASGEAGPEATQAFDRLRRLSADVRGHAEDDPTLRVTTIRQWALVHGFAMLLTDNRIDQPEDYETLLRQVLAPGCHI